MTLHHFREIWLLDFEFAAAEGDLPSPRCMVATELFTGRTFRLWESDLTRLDRAPFDVGAGTLVVAYYASAEIACFRALGWPVPENVLDLYTEFRQMTNGLALPCGRGLIGALTYFGQASIAAVEKDAMRELAMRGGPYTHEERTALLDYCSSDVDSLVRLLPRMEPHLDLPRALLRGRFMVVAADIERTGIPIDVEALSLLRSNWSRIKEELVNRLDHGIGLFDGLTFREERFAAWLEQQGVPWPRHPSGRLALDDNTFKEMSRLFAVVRPVKDLRHVLSKMRLEDLSVGSDGRNRTLLSAFASKTSRCQPSNSRYIFGAASWLRGLVKPPAGWGLAYIDWSQQEWGVMAALSRDRAMMQAYRSGDPYLTFAKQAGAVPSDGTKTTHKEKRSVFKATALAVQYGMGLESLALRIDRTRAHANELLELHKNTYADFWRYSDRVIDAAMLLGHVDTVFGWRLHVVPDTNPRTLRNFPGQANGGEMLRIACVLASERGVSICATIHDAVLIQAPVDDLDDATRAMQEAMAEASAIVLDGFTLSSDVKKILHPERFVDEDRGREMWALVWDIVFHLTGVRLS